MRSAVTQQRQAARLAGRPLPSLLDCAESVCSQAAAGLEQEQFGPTQLSQLAGQLSQLNREDQEELQRLVALLRRMRTAVGREPLPQAVLRVLQVGCWCSAALTAAKAWLALRGSKGSSPCSIMPLGAWTWKKKLEFILLFLASFDPTAPILLVHFAGERPR